MPSDPVAPDAAHGAARRLHAFSWLFVLLTQLRQVALPLILLLVLGRGAWWELAGAIGALVLAIYSLVYSFGFRYWLGATELVVKEGILFRTERHIPFARIQNVVERRNPLHRFFGVTELRLESAGGSRPEAVMNVITVADAAHLTRVLRGTAGVDAPADDATPANDDLLALSIRDTLLLGLLTNRGWVALGFAAYFASQFEPWESPDWRFMFRYAGEWLGFGVSLFHGPHAKLFGWMFAVGAFVAALKLMSIAMAVFAFHGFRLRRDDERVATETGLLTRHGANARRDKIQRLVVGESWLARRFGRRWLSCDVAAGAREPDQEENSRLKWLVPVGTPERIDAVVRDIAPQLSLECVEWQPLHPRAWRRMAKSIASIAVLPALPGSFFLGAELVLPIVVIVCLWGVLVARGWARFAAYGWDGEVLAFRQGWLGRTWVVTRIDKGQVVALRQSPFDRRNRMARIAFDTAGASMIVDELEIPYLDEAVARKLFAELQAAMGEPAGTSSAAVRATA